MGSADMSWGYEDINGPTTWYGKYPSARGSRQSPINIEVNKVVHDRQFMFRSPLSFHYRDFNHKQVLTNTGASWQVNVHGTGSVIEGGPLENDRYELAQFHCHWGRQDDKGSEHTVNGRHHPAEIHFVHWNKDKCINVQQAASQNCGLTVIGVFLELGSENKELRKITSALNRVVLKGQETELDSPVIPSAMFPKKDQTYWTYDGSLTTPPCHESVNWILFKSPVEISWEQLQTFRQLSIDSALGPRQKMITENYRPVQPVGARVVKEVANW